MIPLFAIPAGLAALAGLVILAVWFGGTWFRFARYHRHTGRDLPDGPGWRHRLATWITEADALLRVAWWKVEAGPRLLVPPDPGVPVLCVHGFTQDRTNFTALRRRLWRAGRPSEALDLGLPGRHPRRYAPALASAIRRMLETFPDQPLDVVCHSMGGLILRETLHENPDLAARVRTILTLGSPHHGTAAARGPLRVWPEAGGLHRRSDWIAELPGFAETAPEARIVTVAGTADYVVYPVETCHLPGSEAVDAVGLGHAGLLAHPDVMSLVVDVLEGRPVPRRATLQRHDPARAPEISAARPPTPAP